jgi:tRNA(Ile)-lysidine synthase
MSSEVKYAALHGRSLSLRGGGETADAADLKSAGVIPVWVRIPPALWKPGPLAGHFLFLTPDVQNMTISLEKEVKSILQRAAITPDVKIVVGVSGGPDSLALLHILKGIMLTECLVVGHLNHLLRQEAGEEARFVARMAASWNIPIHLEEVNVAELASRGGLSVEEAARKARYSFLLELAKRFGAQFIAVAHNADDQAETVMLNLLRGTGLAGLAGMEAVRPLPGQQKILLVRPFLFVPRSAIENYCHNHKLNPVLDTSNEDLAYRRNFVRHELLPYLSSINPRFKEHVQQLAELVRADEAFLEQQTARAWNDILLEQEQEWLRLDRRQWKALPLSLQRRTLRHAIKVVRSSPQDLSLRTIEQALSVARDGQTGAESTLPGNLVIQVVYDDLIIRAGSVPDFKNQPQLLSGDVLPLEIPGEVELADGWRITAEESSQNLASVKGNSDPWRAYVGIGEDRQLLVRARVAGERFQPLGMDGRSISLQDLMVNLKLPAPLRLHWPLVAEEGNPVWLIGYRVDERAKVTPRSERVVLLRCKRNAD